MTCDICSWPIGKIINMNPLSHVGCETCSLSHKGFYPRPGEYVGLQGEYHVFIYTEPFSCPDCGALIVSGIALCEGDGYSIELPVLVEEGELFGDN